MPIRQLTVDRHQASKTVVEVLQEALRLSRAEVKKHLSAGKVRLANHPCRAPGRRVRAGQVLQITLPEKKKPAERPAPREQKEPPLSPLAKAIRIRFLDEHIVVVDKPAGLTTVRHASDVEEVSSRARKFLPPTLVDLLPSVLPAKERRGRLRAVHRLDKETSGLVVLARTPEAESHLGKQFRAHTIERQYVALVRGQAQTERIETFLVRDRGDGRRGSGSADGGQKAITNVHVREKIAGFTLVECRLETGRTHQVRIHLGERGTPLCGERVYDRPLHGRPLPDGSKVRRPLLHSAFLAIDHPHTGERLSWTAPWPRDLEETLQWLKRGR